MCDSAGFFRPWKGEAEIEARKMDERMKRLAPVEGVEERVKRRDSEDEEDTDSVDSSWSSECYRTSENSRGEYIASPRTSALRIRRRRSLGSSCSTGSCDEAPTNGNLYGFTSFGFGAKSDDNERVKLERIADKDDRIAINGNKSPGEASSASSSSTCDSPCSAFTPTTYGLVYPCLDYQSPFLVDTFLPNWSQRHNAADQMSLLYGLAAMPVNGYGSAMEEAVKYIQQQDVAAKQIKKLRPKKFRCVHCDVAFSNNGQLKGHIRIHTGERPFKCEIDGCNKAFTRNEELTRHRKIHTGLKPHSCELCGKSFGRKDHLKKHQRTHQNRGIPAHFGTSMFGFIEHPGHYQAPPSSRPVAPYYPF